MVVVTLIGILVVMAMPSMQTARWDRRVYDHAGNIAQLYREARSRAMAKGGAVVVAFRNAGAGGAGQFRTYDAVSTRLVSSAVVGRTPDNRCKRGNVNLGDANTNVLVNEYELDATDVQGHIRADGRGPGAPSTFEQSTVCITPLGRIYYLGNTSGLEMNFDAVLPMTGAFDIHVRRQNASDNTKDMGLRRRVVVPPNGVARVLSRPKEVGDPS